MSKQEDNQSKAVGRRLTELRRSNAPGKMLDKRTKRQRDRSTRERNAREEDQ